MQNNEWLNDRITYLKGLKSRKEQQELLIILSEKTNRTVQEEKKLKAILKAEKAIVKATKARQVAANLISAEKKSAEKAERTARTHELCNSAGLLILAGLVDKKSGKPTLDQSELLGALLGLAKVPSEDPRRKEWKRVGDSLLLVEDAESAVGFKNQKYAAV
jgi:Conjugal transfer protein TraD